MPSTNSVQFGPRTAEIRPPNGALFKRGCENLLNNQQQLSFALRDCIEI